MDDYPLHYFYSLEVLDRRSLGRILVDSGILGSDYYLEYLELRRALESYIFDMEQFKGAEKEVYCHITAYNLVPKP